MSTESRDSKRYIFIHLGARAHYQFPEALSDKIHTLYTDVWIPTNFLTYILSLLPFSFLKKILQRNNSKIPSSKVISFPFSLLAHELIWKLTGLKGWEKIMRRNNWFQQKVKYHISKNTNEEHLVIFAFAYTALEILKLAKGKEWKTILYQMDPGLEEEEIVKKEMIISSHLYSSWASAPSSYWEQWQEELELADIIIVNSLWSKSALLKTMGREQKIKIVPLALEANKETAKFNRIYPKNFNQERPLRILFLGVLSIRKGLRPILEVIELLRDEPVEFTFVGTPETKIPENPKVNVVPSVSRTDTAKFYKMADIFLFPTLSDGFGLTQLEAFQWKLPIISSRYCGEVVEDNINGILLEEVTSERISEAILRCLHNPNLLQSFSEKTFDAINKFTLNRLAEELEVVFD